ncbi:MAG TPA: pseudaminic acid synthase [Blastocatellia bacterium]|nr:pseudaminic acid synthase [Blastocatellia bacterium]
MAVNTQPEFSIGGRKVGPLHPPYIIAEMSANHNQDFDEAVAILEAAKAAGADAVKLQTYTADTLTLSSDLEWFRVGAGSLWEGRTLHSLYQEAYTPWDWQPRLKTIANSLGLDLFSSPFDETAVDFLEGMDVPAYKVASFEIVDLALITRIASTGKPVIISTGMATVSEIEQAVGVCRGVGSGQIALLKCVSAYPAPPDEMNLRTIPDMARRFSVPVGLSDHTLGIAVPVAGVALGACIIEKHFTLSRSRPGPDSAFSLEPDEFKAMVDSVRTVEKALGCVSYKVTPSEESSTVFRRSLFVVKDIKAGEVLSTENVRSIRPGYGLAPRHLVEILGRTATRNLHAGTPLSWDVISDQ